MADQCQHAGREAATADGLQCADEQSAEEKGLARGQPICQAEDEGTEAGEQNATGEDAVGAQPGHLQRANANLVNSLVYGIMGSKKISKALKIRQ
jgi:hypothetical protein